MSEKAREQMSKWTSIEGVDFMFHSILNSTQSKVDGFVLLCLPRIAGSPGEHVVGGYAQKRFFGIVFREIYFKISTRFLHQDGFTDRQ